MKPLPDQSQSQSPLLALPPELRNTIYELAFSDIILDLDEETRAPCLLSSCRQIRIEAYDIFYRTVVFETNARDKAFDFLSGVPPRIRASITEFRYFTEMTSGSNWSCSAHSPKNAQWRLDELVQMLKISGIELRPGVLLASIKAKTEETIWSCEPEKDPRRHDSNGITKWTQRKTTGGRAPRKQLASSK